MFLPCVAVYCIHAQVSILPWMYCDEVVSAVDTNIQIYLHRYAHMHIKTDTYIYTYIYTLTHIILYALTCTHMHIHTCTHTNMHTHAN